MLMLDAAYPPPPGQLVADARAVGAEVVAAYVYGGITNYTPAHYDALNNAGIHILPIIVPGNYPPSYAALEQLLSSSGFQNGPVVTDLEPLSLPPAGWVAGLPAALPGFQHGLYGTTGVLKTYPMLGWRWLAYWPSAPGVWNPVPALIAGWDAWQYAHDVTINGSVYDISIIEGIFNATVPDDMTPEQDTKLQTIAQDTAIITEILGEIRGAFQFDQGIKTELDAVLAKVTTGAQDTAIITEILGEIRGAFQFDQGIKTELDAVLTKVTTGGTAAPTDPQVIALLQQIRGKFAP